MPPNKKYTREQIVDTGFEIVRETGWKGLSTRSLAARLGSSPIPIYSCFSSIKNLETEIIKKVIECQQSYMNRRYTADLWHDHGIGYVLFAVEQRQLFLSINDESHFVIAREYGQHIWDACNRALSGYPYFKDLSADQIYDVQLKRWMLAHGLAFHACFAPSINMDNVKAHIREGSQAILDGLKQQYRQRT